MTLRFCAHVYLYSVLQNEINEFELDLHLLIMLIPIKYDFNTLVI